MFKKEEQSGRLITEDMLPAGTRYLKYWYHDYPYLTNKGKSMKSLFPVPVESKDEKDEKPCGQLNKMREII